MKRIIIIVALVAAAGLLVRTIAARGTEDTVHYRLVNVEQGDLEAVVSATGTLDAVTTVQVGTQVSGTVEAIFVDYNDPVHAGQVIARIDTTLLESAVASAEAQLARAQAELRQARREHKRIAALHDEGLVSDSEDNTAQYSLDLAEASVQSAQVDLDRARQNLSYATITAPIDGTVIDRTVDVGQTVQASFSAPELFLIAGDLSAMQILASVDESDIGEIAEGQTVRFTVQAYPDDDFSGTVRQVRLQSATEENVVNYTAVVDVPNADGRLLPGMTATVDFLVQTAQDVMYVANAALRYQPDEDTARAAMERLRASRQAADGADQQRQGPPAGVDPTAAADRGLLWALDDDGQLTPVPVLTGLSDGSNTEVAGRSLEAGRQIVAGVSAHAVSNTSSNPFQQNQQQRRPGPPPGGGF